MLNNIGVNSELKSVKWEVDIVQILQILKGNIWIQHNKYYIHKAYYDDDDISSPYLDAPSLLLMMAPASGRITVLS